MKDWKNRTIQYMCAVIVRKIDYKFPMYRLLRLFITEKCDNILVRDTIVRIKPNNC